MLKQRIITSIFALSLFIFTVIFLSPLHYAIFTALVWLIAAWEWSNLAGYKHMVGRFLSVTLIIGLQWLVLIFITTELSWKTGEIIFNKGYLKWLLGLFCASWIIILVWLLNYPKYKQAWGRSSVLLVIGLIFLLPGWLTMVYLKSVEVSAVFAVVFIVIFVDTGAYFIGSKFGNKKLAPQLSPAKSWAGFYGGVVAALLITIFIGFFIIQPKTINEWITVLLLGLVTALAAVYGDLLESMVKRFRGVKDSGEMLPGHGGILDRVDGLLAALPIFTLIALLAKLQFVSFA